MTRRHSERASYPDAGRACRNAIDAAFRSANGRPLGHADALVLLALVRELSTYSRTADVVSPTGLAAVTGLARGSVYRSLARLDAAGVFDLEHGRGPHSPVVAFRVKPSPSGETVETGKPSPSGETVAGRTVSPGRDANRLRQGRQLREGPRRTYAENEKPKTDDDKNWTSRIPRSTVVRDDPETTPDEQRAGLAELRSALADAEAQRESEASP